MDGGNPVQKMVGESGYPSRVVITNVRPEVDGGRYPIKRVRGEEVTVTADILVDGHDLISAVLLRRPPGQQVWTEVPMLELGNDRWQGSFRVSETGQHSYTVQGWVDVFKSWRRDLQKRIEAKQASPVDLTIGADLIARASRRASGQNAQDAQELQECAKSVLELAQGDLDSAMDRILDEQIKALLQRYPDRRFGTTYEKVLSIVVDREKARFSTWYEMFPRSCASRPGVHGTFRDCIARLPYVAEMGFDVLYLPPIHPIGRTHRKGKNNKPVASPDAVGSPWAIGSTEGGHKAIHPQLGTLEDFHQLLKAAHSHGIEIALDLAFQCSADHPYLKEHPEWFRIRPDGTMQYAENPPKKYEDIYPLHFATEDWRALWDELKSIVLFWIHQGVHLFRVDNPHTKPLSFWEWLIAEVKRDHPDVLFLAEAFTRPKLMYELAKRGFSQSYTYFTWRNAQGELTQYFTELTRTDIQEFFRANLWPNTPDILAEYLQSDGRTAFMVRLILAATLGPSYGIYGPAFELCENRALKADSEDYLDSEKYQIQYWEVSRPDSLKDLIRRVNCIRRDHAPLQSNGNLEFHRVDNEQILAYSKTTEDRSDIILVVVNLNPYHTHSGWVELPLEKFGLPTDRTYQMHDLLTDARYLWQGARNVVELNPNVLPGHVFRIRRHVRTETDFDYFA